MTKTRWPQSWLRSVGKLLIRWGEALSAQPSAVYAPDSTVMAEQASVLPDDRAAPGPPAHWLALLAKAELPLQWQGHQPAIHPERTHLLSIMPTPLTTPFATTEAGRPATEPIAPTPVAVTNSVAPQAWTEQRIPPLPPAVDTSPLSQPASPLADKTSLRGAKSDYSYRLPAPRLVQTPVALAMVAALDVESSLQAKEPDAAANERVVGQPVPILMNAVQRTALPLPAAIDDVPARQPAGTTRLASQPERHEAASVSSMAGALPTVTPDSVPPTASRPMAQDKPWPEAPAINLNRSGQQSARAWPQLATALATGPEPPPEKWPASLAQPPAGARTLMPIVPADHAANAPRNFTPFRQIQWPLLPRDRPAALQSPASPSASGTEGLTTQWPTLPDERWARTENDHQEQERWLAQQRQRWEAEQEGRLEGR